MWSAREWYEKARQSAAAQPRQVLQMAEFRLQNLKAHMPDTPREEIVRTLQELNQQRLDAVPDLTRYPELRGMRELVQARWRGARDGADLDEALWAMHCDSGYYTQRYISSGRVGTLTRAEDGCTYVFFPTSDRGPLLANNLDSSPDEPFGRPSWPAINEHLLMGGVSSGVFLDETPPEIFPAPVGDLLARYCRTTEEALELLERYNYFWGPGNRILIDRKGEVAIIEKSACRMGVRRSPDGFGFVTAMTAEDPQFRAFLDDRRRASLEVRGLDEDCNDVIFWAAADRRRESMRELLDEACNQPTLEAMRGIIQSHRSPAESVCRHAEPLRPGGPHSGYTLRTTIWRLREGRAMWWARDGETPPCQNRQSDVEYEDVLIWD